MSFLPTVTTWSSGPTLALRTTENFFSPICSYSFSYIFNLLEEGGILDIMWYGIWAYIFKVNKWNDALTEPQIINEHCRSDETFCPYYKYFYSDHTSFPLFSLHFLCFFSSEFSWVRSLWQCKWDWTSCGRTCFLSENSETVSPVKHWYLFTNLTKEIKTWMTGTIKKYWLIGLCLFVTTYCSCRLKACMCICGHGKLGCFEKFTWCYSRCQHFFSKLLIPNTHRV